MLALYMVKKYDDACNEPAIVMRLGCNHWRIKWHMAHSAYEGGNYLLAEESLCSLLSEFPLFEEARSLLESTIKELNSPASLSNISPQGHLALANQYQNEGKYVEAAREIENAISKGMDDDDVRYQYAQLLIATQQIERAEIELRELVIKSPGHTFHIMISASYLF
jgi:tetratricopeptide (TPR) repeat protein